MSCLFGLGFLLLSNVAKIGLLETFYDHIFHEPIDNATLFVEILVNHQRHISTSLKAYQAYRFR